jgi:hypothetical protein
MWRLAWLTLPSLLLISTSACDDDPRRAPRGVCDTAAGALAGCAPDTPSDTPLTIEAACDRLVRCGAFALEGSQEGQDRDRDWQNCLNTLRGDEFTAERLRFTLDCVQVSTCDDLRQDHCLDFGSGNP